MNITKITLTNPTNSYDDILIELTNDDGKTIKVNIPQQIFDWTLEDYEIFGLNLVSMGHYQ